MGNLGMKDFFRAIASKGRSLFSKQLNTLEDNKNLSDLAWALLGNKGEATSIALADQFHETYLVADTAKKLDFFVDIALNFGPDEGRLDAKIENYKKDKTALSISVLHKASEPLRQELLRRLNLAPFGTEKLLRMREDLLSFLLSEPRLKVVDLDFKHLFSSWFNRGFLTINKIDWDTPASILEKIISYEAVHEIHTWEELRGRIDPEDRCCFAFFHPALPGEPLIFIEVALSDHIATEISSILSVERNITSVEKINTAVFYSISNCQVGLKGISFGNFLIKQVVEELKRDYGDLETFITLSPVPGFMRWLLKESEANTQYFKLLQKMQNQEWWRDDDLCKQLSEPLIKTITSYLLETKADPVARFHLGNGARLEQINWLADPSEKAIQSSAGFMVNYQYVLPQIEKNHEQYTTQGQVSASSKVLSAYKK